jgi:hypothetical protein
MQPTTKGDQSSALPMRGLSPRAQKQLAPRRYGQMPPPIEPRHAGHIPQALRSGVQR